MESVRYYLVHLPDANSYMIIDSNETEVLRPIAGAFDVIRLMRDQQLMTAKIIDFDNDRVRLDQALRQQFNMHQQIHPHHQFATKRRRSTIDRDERTAAALMSVGLSAIVKVKEEHETEQSSSTIENGEPSTTNVNHQDEESGLDLLSKNDQHLQGAANVEREQSTTISETISQPSKQRKRRRNCQQLSNMSSSDASIVFEIKSLINESMNNLNESMTIHFNHIDYQFAELTSRVQTVETTVHVSFEKYHKYGFFCSPRDP